jgi:hypothetical protein
MSLRTKIFGVNDLQKGQRAKQREELAGHTLSNFASGSSENL